MYKVAHIGVIVRDCERSTEFYSKTLGLEKMSVFEDERLKAVFLQAENQIIELLQYKDGAGSLRGAGVVDHIAFEVEDIEVAVARLKDQGVALLFEAPKTVMNGKKIMFFTGPDGERLELVQEARE